MGTTCAAQGARDTFISDNHEHAAVVPASDFSATGEKVYDITGAANHGHSITLTQAHRATLLSGTPVTVASTLLGHTHQVTLVCA